MPQPEFVTPHILPVSQPCASVAVTSLACCRGGTREKAYKTINSAFEASVRIEDCMRK
jgi:hypothetical protein